jgi:hypothetical protein
MCAHCLAPESFSNAVTVLFDFQSSCSPFSWRKSALLQAFGFSFTQVLQQEPSTLDLSQLHISELFAVDNLSFGCFSFMQADKQFFDDWMLIVADK